MDQEPDKETPEVSPEPHRDLYQITVLRQKGQPIRPAYRYNVTPTLTLEGSCLVDPRDIDADTRDEIEYLAKCGILDVRPYVDAKDVEPDAASTAEADKVRAAMDAGEMSDPFPDTRTVKPPPPLLKVHDPIKTEKPDWEQARKEQLEQLRRPDPTVRDAVTGEQTGGPEEKEPEPDPEPEVEEPVEDPTPEPDPTPEKEPEPEEQPKKKRRRRRK